MLNRKIPHIALYRCYLVFISFKLIWSGGPSLDPSSLRYPSITTACQETAKTPSSLLLIEIKKKQNVKTWKSNQTIPFPKPIIFSSFSLESYTQQMHLCLVHPFLSIHLINPPPSQNEPIRAKIWQDTASFGLHELKNKKCMYGHWYFE